MYIDLDFIPDTIVYFKRIDDTNEYVVRKLWGDEQLFRMGQEFFTSMIPKENRAVILCLQKNSLRFKVLEVNDSKEENDR